jgi:MazG family protein
MPPRKSRRKITKNSKKRAAAQKSKPSVKRKTAARRNVAAQPAATSPVPGETATSDAKLTPGQWFDKLVAVQARLRGPGGCPWDIEQTHESLRTYLLEESYEVLEALESGDDAKFADEMGDLLFQVVFHSQIATEEGRFTAADVIREIHDKMVRRHPHVFGDVSAKDSAEVLRNWEQIKAEERRAKSARSGEKGGAPAASVGAKPASLLDGVSKALPATLEGFQLTRKAARIGFDWDDVDGVFEKLNEETAEVRSAVAASDQKSIEEEIGDVLFAAVNLARFLKVDPEIALKKANAKFTRRFHEMERLARESGREFKNAPRDEMEALWESAKVSEEWQEKLPQLSAASGAGAAPAPAKTARAKPASVKQ